MKAVKEAAPGAVVEDECVDICGGPIKVEIIKMLEGKAVTLYETDQRNLFSKYVVSASVATVRCPRLSFHMHRDHLTCHSSGTRTGAPRLSRKLRTRSKKPPRRSRRSHDLPPAALDRVQFGGGLGVSRSLHDVRQRKGR